MALNGRRFTGALAALILAANGCLAEDVNCGRYEGNGEHISRPFSVTAPWEVAWSTNEHAYIAILDLSANVIDEFSTGMDGSRGSAYMVRGGQFLLRVRSIGKWRVALTCFR